jgi:CRISPR-associated protein Cas6
MTSEVMVDVVFPVRGETVAGDHALLLWREIERFLPWLRDEPGAGVLPLTGLSPGDGLHFVGGRARLVIRMPQRRLASAELLTDAQLDLQGVIHLGKPTERKIESARVVHSPFVDMGTTDEGEFQSICQQALVDRGMRPEMVCGRSRSLNSDGGTIRGFSVMLYGLNLAQTLALQELGLGQNHHLGCGIFVPHKNVAAVSGD